MGRNFLYFATFYENKTKLLVMTRTVQDNTQNILYLLSKMYIKYFQYSNFILFLIF